MRHAEVSYAGERDPEVVRLTKRGLEQAGAAHRALEDVNYERAS
jgi:broad specificity phosphatase PhoE